MILFGYLLFILTASAVIGAVAAICLGYDIKEEKEKAKAKAIVGIIGLLVFSLFLIIGGLLGV